MKKNSKQFAKDYGNLSLNEKLNLINERPSLYMGSAEIDHNGFLVVHAVSYKLNEKFECTCPTVNKIKKDYRIPREYCYCCGGQFKYHYEIMLGLKLELEEIISSPHDTNRELPCAFRYHIIPGNI